LDEGARVPVAPPHGLEQVIATFGDIFAYVGEDHTLDPIWQIDQLATIPLLFPIALSWGPFAAGGAPDLPQAAAGQVRSGVPGHTRRWIAVEDYQLWGVLFVSPATQRNRTVDAFMGNRHRFQS